MKNFALRDTFPRLDRTVTRHVAEHRLRTVTRHVSCGRFRGCKLPDESPEAWCCGALKQGSLHVSDSTVPEPVF